MKMKMELKPLHPTDVAMPQDAGAKRTLPEADARPVKRPKSARPPPPPPPPLPPPTTATPSPSAAKPAAKPGGKPARRDKFGVAASAEPRAPVAVEQPNWKKLQAILKGTSATTPAVAPAPLIAAGAQPAGSAPAGLVADAVVTDKLGLDCEMVGVGAGGERSVLARVVVVNWNGCTVYDALVKPREHVTDYRTWITGLGSRELKRGRDFFEVQAEVAELIRGRMLIGHALHNDFSALMLSHPKAMVRDTSQYVPLRSQAARRTGKTAPRALRKLAAEELGMEIQGGAHDPAEDAVASLLLYRRHAAKWEKALRGGPKERAAVIKGARVKRKAMTPEQRLSNDRRKQRELKGRAEKSSNAAAAAADPVGHAREARVEAALPAPRPTGGGGRGTNASRPAFLH
jgi:RNA exonuclease 4